MSQRGQSAYLPSKGSLAATLQACTLTLLALTASVIAQTPASQPLQLAEAHRRGFVSLEIVGTGGSSGDVISVVVQRKVRRPLRLVLDPGTVLRSSSPNVQNMVVAALKGRWIDAKRYAPAKVIELTDDASHTYLVEAYCLDFLKDNPGVNDRFTLGALDAAVLKVIQTTSAPGRAPSVIQAALWLSQGVAETEIDKRFPLKPTEWTVARASVASQPKRVEPAKDIWAEIDKILKPVKSGVWSGQTHVGEIFFVVSDDGTDTVQVRFYAGEKSPCANLDLTRGLVIRESVPIFESQFELEGNLAELGKFSMDGNFNNAGTQASGSWKLDRDDVTICRGGWVATSGGA